jgi:putative chitinase
MTPKTLQSLYGIKSSDARRWAGPIRDALELAECDTHWRISAWLAQVGHESGRLRYTRELWGPTKQQLRYEPTTSLSRQLGNTRSGDGSRYRGRGLIQTTGRANHAMTTVKLRELIGNDVPDFEAQPEQLQSDKWAALSAGLFWRVKTLNRFADSGDFAQLTKRINGGYNGLADRQMLYARALMIQ